MYKAKIVLDSRNPVCGVRLTTFVIDMPRIVLAEFNTHRVFSRNAASSRAIPLKKRIEATIENPFIPVFREEQKGMVPADFLQTEKQEEAESIWRAAMAQMMAAAEDLGELGVHKQWANRLLEPFQFVQVLVSSTEWDNFFDLRCAPNAQDEIRIVAELMKTLYENNEPVTRYEHIPFFEVDDGTPEQERVKRAVARCARLSYNNLDGSKADPQKDIALYDKLKNDKHWSPFEHVAFATNSPTFIRNFRGWRQHRTQVDNK